MSCCSPLGPNSGGCCGPTGSPLIIDTATLNIRTLAGPTTVFPEPLAPYWAPDGTLNAGLVEAWGAGGGASASVAGGGGAYAAQTIPLVGGLVVSGMSGLRTAADTNGADVHVGSVVAQGGRSGTNGGTGGLASASTGTTKFDGGTGGDTGSSGGGAGGTSGAGTKVVGGEDGGPGAQGTVDSGFGAHFPGGGGQKTTAATRQGATGAGRISFYRPRAPGRPALIGVTWFRNIPANGSFAVPQGKAGDFLVTFLTANTTSLPTMGAPWVPVGGVNPQVYTLLATDSGPATATLTGGIPAPVICFRFRHATGVGAATSVITGPAPVPNPIGALATQYQASPPTLAGGPGYGILVCWQRRTGTTPDFQPACELVAAPSGYNNLISMPNEGIGVSPSTLQQTNFAFDYVESNFQAPGPWTFQGASAGALVPGNAIGAATLLVT